MQKILTDDGSFTVVHTKYGATYHSTHGALNESEIVFIQNGLDYVIQRVNKRVQFLEIGFGTGLNFLLTIEKLINKKIELHYDAVELYPILWTDIKDLNYIDHIHGDTLLVGNIFEACHTNHKYEYNINPLTLHFKLYQEDILLHKYRSNFYNVVYYDAFGPDVQYELWTKEMADKMYDCLKPGGVLTTYCVQGNWKRNLKASGFKIEKLPGPPGKREVLRAHKE